MRAYIKAFVAGVVAMLVANQAVLWGFDRLDVMQTIYWNTHDFMDTRVPVLAVLALWGAVWGLIIWSLIKSAQAAGYYVAAILFGAILLTGVSVALASWFGPGVFGVSLADYDMNAIAVVAGANAAYGLLFAIVMRVLHPLR